MRRSVLLIGLALATASMLAEAQRPCTSSELSGIRAMSARVVTVDSTLLDFGVSKGALERLLVSELRAGGLEVVPDAAGVARVSLEARAPRVITPALDYAFYVRIALVRPDAESVDSVVQCELVGFENRIASLTEMGRRVLPVAERQIRVFVNLWRREVT